jgi:heat shock protein HtpX
MTQGSIAARAAIAVVLMVGFYALALGMLVGLVYIPYAEWSYAGRLHLKLAFGCLLGAGAIALAIVPRVDRFEDPGPELEPQRFARLFACIAGIAQRTGQAMPAQVFLVGDMNAWVAHRGGVMGFGSKRVMGIGWPLLQVLSVKQLEAVLAHEFGHYHGGDTRLGPWIYKTRSAIGRTLESLGNEGWLHLPFKWYGTLFLRLTHAVSRAQELAADRLAAHVAGARAMIEGLKRVHAGAAAFDAYWAQEVSPVLSDGYRTPLARGFSTFMRVARIQTAMQSFVARELEAGETDPYDTHPALRDRIAALGGDVKDAGLEVAEDGGGPAIELLGDVDAAESMLLAFLIKQSSLKPIGWDEVPETLLVPRWRSQAVSVAPILNGLELGQLPRVVREQKQAILKAVLTRSIPEENVPQVLAAVAGSWLVMVLLERGFTPRSPLGESHSMHRGDRCVEPFSVAAAVSDPAADAGWLEAIRAAGVEAASLTLDPRAK